MEPSAKRRRIKSTMIELNEFMNQRNETNAEDRVLIYQQCIKELSSGNDDEILLEANKVLDHVFYNKFMTQYKNEESKLKFCDADEKIRILSYFCMVMR